MARINKMLLSDGAVNYLLDNVSASDTRITMRGTEGFPVIPTPNTEGFYFAITVIRVTDNAREDMRVTEFDGNEWVVERAVGDAQVAIDIPCGSLVIVSVSSYLMSQIYSEIVGLLPTYDPATKELIIKSPDAVDTVIDLTNP